MTAKNPTWQTSRNTDRQQKNPNKRAREKRWQENNLPFATELFPIQHNGKNNQH